MFNSGQWSELVNDVVAQQCRESQANQYAQEDEQVKRGMAAQSKIQRDQVSRARQALTGAELAPKTEETFQLLQGRRPAQIRAISDGWRSTQTLGEKLRLQSHEVFRGKLHHLGSAPGPGGCTNEMLRVCLDDAEVLQLLRLAAEDFARGSATEEITKVFIMASMTALRKSDGGVRGIATGTSFRRLVARTLARQFMREVEKTCAPFQFALSTRAGTDCVGHAVRGATDLDPRMTVLSIDAIGAYDHVYRSSMLDKLLEV